MVHSAKTTQREEQGRIRTQQQQQTEHGQESQVRLRKPMSLPLRSSSPNHRASLSPKPLPAIPLLARIAPLIALLVAAVVLVTSLNPSPWLDSSLPLFLRRPPPLTSETSAPSSPVQGCQDLSITALEPRENAAIVLLIRESDLDELLPTLRNFEARFNAHFRYPYVFITSPDDPPLPAQFRDAVAGVLPDGAVTEWGQVPDDHWRIPKWMDEGEVRIGFEKQQQQGVQYAAREGYHHMCRWFSGLFARHPLLTKYDWFWRVEPGVRFYCDITYDPFRLLALRNKLYGFVIAVVENRNTIPTLFRTVLDYIEDKGLKVDPALWKFLARKNKLGVEDFTGFHFWTNFEIGDLRFFRSPEYQAFFTALDEAGGFYSERWGDAPVRALALGLLADINKIHYFEDLAYQHDWFMHCPAHSASSPPSSFPGLEKKFEKATGCRCDCPKAGSLQGRKKGQELRDMDTDWEYSALEFWRTAVQQARLGPPD
ncbi:hypothetical protein JCM1840_002860 [Sporobolomyces johnsonii]